MKAKHVLTSGMLVVIAHSSAAQGIPVLDAANLAQAVNQVLAWEQQYKQMLQQIEQLQQQTDLATRNLSSMTGTRSLGEITNAIPTSVLDPNLRNTIASIASHADLNAYGSGQLASLQQATLTRYSQIQSLMRSINQTNDPKSIAELQGRIQSEQAMIANEQKEAELLRMSLDQQRRAIDAARVQFNARASMQPLQAN
jgi:type IV secretion system protein VirB5